jgi:2-oxoglutarate dehydrogenase E2 component (dihydrolipoamide succinyltransferase)
VRLPHLGVCVTEATIVKWLVSPADSVEAGQPICEVATDKVDVLHAADESPLHNSTYVELRIV